MRIKTRTIDGHEVTVKTESMTSANMLVVEVGTNGFKGGDSGHGSRTFLRIYDEGGTDIRVRKLTDRYYFSNGGAEIVVGGDSELITLIQALEFAVNTLKEQAHWKDDEDDETSDDE